MRGDTIDGHSGVFKSDGEVVTDLAVSSSQDCPVLLFTSHPDINQAGAMTVYGKLKSGEEAVVRLTPDGPMVTTGVLGQFSMVGPLGPTMNEHGDIAFRGTSVDGKACIQVWRGDRLHAVAVAGQRFSGFEGLPVVNNRGDVAFRANLADGQQGVFVLGRNGQCDEMVVTGGDFEEIAPFPTMNDRGEVAFAARYRGGAGWGLFIAGPKGVGCLVGAEAGFESYRGILMNNAGPVVFYGTPAGGQLGIYAGPDPAQHRVVGLGDPLFGATVVGFALNPVSVNECGQFAVRVALDDKRQFLLRGDLAG